MTGMVRLMEKDYRMEFTTTSYVVRAKKVRPDREA